MDWFTFDYSESDGGVEVPPVIETGPGGETIFIDGEVIAEDGLSIGIPTGGATGGYSFPLPIGADSYVLASNTTSNSLVWVPNAGSSGDIVNGGQFGPVSVGTIDVTPFNLISGGVINIGAIGGPDEINLNGSISYQYNNISSGIVSFNLTSYHYFVEISNPATTSIILPASSISAGRQYVISKGYGGGMLSIIPAIGDTVDGLGSFDLTLLDMRVTVISDGSNKWLIV